MKDLASLGSQTAKNGFQNERDVVDAFNNWQNDVMAQEWLKAISYNLITIEYV